MMYASYCSGIHKILKEEMQVSKIEMAWKSFNFILKACSKATSKNDVREALRYIELRADGETCVATALDGYIMQQVRVECTGMGAILIPGDLKAERAETVEISVEENLHVKYFDERKKLIVGYELPKYNGPFVDWRKIPKSIERAESVIHCDARYLRKIVAATTCAKDQIISISIPENKEENIRIASRDAQSIILPIRVFDKDFRRIYSDWFREIPEA